MFRKQGVGVESLPRRSPFTITFTDGHAMEGELYGYGVALGGLGLYVANGSELATRMFVPASGIQSFTVGERLGELLLSGVRSPAAAWSSRSSASACCTGSASATCCSTRHW
jgi:hypothetical protein